VKLRHIVVAASLSFLLGLVALAPAATVYGWAVGNNDALPVRLNGISGTLLKGSVAQITQRGQPVAVDVHWRLAPAQLLLGRARYHLKTDSPPLLFDGDVSVGLGGTIRLSDARANGELRALAAMAGQSFIPVNGQLGLKLDHLTLVDQWPADALGQVQLIGLAWALGREPVVLGDFEANIERADDRLVARVKSLKGVIDATGSASLGADRAYALDLQLRPLPEAPSMITSMLQSLGRPDSRGYYKVERGGNAPAPAPSVTPSEPRTDDLPPGETPTFGGN
jgi:general secretion pathway protein N